MGDALTSGYVNVFIGRMRAHGKLRYGNVFIGNKVGNGHTWHR